MSATGQTSFNGLLSPLLGRGLFPMVKLEGSFVIPYGAETLRKIRDAPEYGDAFIRFLESVLEAMQQPDWPPGSYYPGGWYRKLLDTGVAPGKEQPTVEAMGAFRGDPLRVDGAGRWWLSRKEVRGRVRRFFVQHLEWDSALSLYRVRYPMEGGEEVQYLETASPPLRVERVGERDGRLWIECNDGEGEPLDLDTLWLDADEQLHCRSRRRDLVARFDDRARWQMLESLEENDEIPPRWTIQVRGRRIPLRVEG